MSDSRPASRRAPKLQEWLPNRMFDPVNNPFAIQNLLDRKRREEEATFVSVADELPASDFAGNPLLQSARILPPAEFLSNALLDAPVSHDNDFQAEYDDGLDPESEFSSAASSGAEDDADQPDPLAALLAEQDEADTLSQISAAPAEGLAEEAAEAVTDAVTDALANSAVASQESAAAILSEPDAVLAEAVLSDATTNPQDTQDTEEHSLAAEALVSNNDQPSENDLAADTEQAAVPAESSADEAAQSLQAALAAAEADSQSAQDDELSSGVLADQGSTDAVPAEGAAVEANTSELATDDAVTPDSEPQLQADSAVDPLLTSEAVAEPEPELISNTEPDLSSEAVTELVDAARAEAREQGRQEAREAAYQEGLEAGISQAKAELQQSIDDRLAVLNPLIKSLQQLGQDPETLFEPLKKLAIHLAEQLVRGELAQSPQVISRLVDNGLRELAASGEKAVIVHLNPEDLDQYKPTIAQFGDSIVLRPDALLTRGSVRASLDGSVVEDLIERRVQGLKKSLAQPAAPGWRPAAPNPLLQRSLPEPPKTVPPAAVAAKAAQEDTDIAVEARHDADHDTDHGHNNDHAIDTSDDHGIGHLPEAGAEGADSVRSPLS